MIYTDIYYVVNIIHDVLGQCEAALAPWALIHDRNQGSVMPCDSSIVEMGTLGTPCPSLDGAPKCYGLWV